MNIMQNLPKKYIDKIINIFGEEGKEWLNNLDRIIEDNAKKYGLNDLKLVNNLTYNFVANAKSEKYGIHNFKEIW